MPWTDCVGDRSSLAVSLLTLATSCRILDSIEPFHRGIHLQVALVRPKEVERPEQRVPAGAANGDLLAGLVPGVDLPRDDPLRGLRDVVGALHVGVRRPRDDGHEVRLVVRFPTAIPDREAELGVMLDVAHYQHDLQILRLMFFGVAYIVPPCCKRTSDLHATCPDVVAGIGSHEIEY